MALGLEAPNVLVAGKYKLTRLLGRGGMGTVWEGVHTSLGTRVAVKFIESDHLDSPEAHSRFHNEARAAATLRSKHVVEVYDHGVAPDGRPFIVMEYLEGEPLDRRLERTGRLAPRDLATILQQVCRALGKAHAAGIVHRDLKPENIFLVWDDEDSADIAKVVDFGIAKFTDQSLGASSATRTGSVLGTPYYMSPEQARGLRSVDHRSDLWSVGVIAFRCLVGKLPFEGEAIGDLLVKICTMPVPVPSTLTPDVPAGFDAFIARALAREPEQRFQSAQELGESLAHVCGLSVRTARVSASALASGGHPAYVPSSATPTPNQAATGAPVTQTPWIPAGSGRKKGRIGAVIAAVAVVGVVAIALANSFGDRPEEDVPEPSAATQHEPPPPREKVNEAPVAHTPPAVVPAPEPVPAASVAPSEQSVQSTFTAEPKRVAPRQNTTRPISRPRPVETPTPAAQPSPTPAVQASPAPAVQPAPAPAAPPSPAPTAQPPRPSKKPPIDVGY